jgi:putative oxidoreductase
MRPSRMRPTTMVVFCRGTDVVEIGGGHALMSGLYTRQAAVGLAIFTVLAAMVFHAFWAAPTNQHMAEQVNFLNNLAISGGMLVLAASAPDPSASTPGARWRETGA